MADAVISTPHRNTVVSFAVFKGGAAALSRKLRGSLYGISGAYLFACWNGVIATAGISVSVMDIVFCMHYSAASYGVQWQLFNKCGEKEADGQYGLVVFFYQRVVETVGKLY